jgi:predicted enzyme related to lactoylglutathione lyase
VVQLVSLVLFANDLAATSTFYRTVGLPLVDEDHDEGPVHTAAELDGVHFAIYQADDAVGAHAPSWRSAASDFAGFYVDSLDDASASLDALGTRILTAHERRPWGCRIVAQDPDGRADEVNQRNRCV